MRKFMFVVFSNASRSLAWPAILIDIVNFPKLMLPPVLYSTCEGGEGHGAKDRLRQKKFILI